jgi:hypothetical protein
MLLRPFYALALSLLSAVAVGCTDDLPLHGSDVAPASAIDSALLSTRGVYADLSARTPAAGALEYVPDQTLWSDGVDKRRWLLLPAGTRIDTSNMDHWRFPVGTKLVKEFALAGAALETRVIEKVADTGDLKTDYFLGTFVWSPGQPEARLTPAGVSNVNGTAHDVPQQELCLQCHQSEPSAVLGVSAVQLSRSGMLTQLAERGLLSVPPGRTFPIPGDDVQRRALGVLHANCGHCHSEGGMGPMMRMRFLPHEADLPLEQTELYRTTIGQSVTDWMPHPPEYSQRVIAGDPDHSAAIYRMEQRSGNGFMMDQMPPIATERRDEEGIALVRAWIVGLPNEGVSRPDSFDASSPQPLPDAAVPLAMDAGVEKPIEIVPPEAAAPDAVAYGEPNEDAGGAMEEAASNPAVLAQDAGSDAAVDEPYASEREAASTAADDDAAVSTDPGAALDTPIQTDFDAGVAP